MSDGASPTAVVHALYDVISGAADEERDWDRFRALFEDGARIAAYTALPDGTPLEGGWSIDEYVAAARELYARQGFWEREVWSRHEEYGTVAHVLSTFESWMGSPDSEPMARGINSVQLVRHDGRWWIASIAYELERPDRPIPAEYL